MAPLSPLVLLLIFLLSPSDGKRRYDGYQVLRVSVTYPDHSQLVHELEQDFKVDVWSQGFDYIDVMVSPEKLANVEYRIAFHKATYAVLHENVQRDIDEERATLATRTKANPSPYLDYDTFNNYTDIMAELDAVVLRCPVSLGVNCETFTIGQSYEGRDLKGLRIYRTDVVQQPIWLDATIHAREWLAVATLLKILSHLVDDYATDAQVQGLVDKYQWYLLPLVNPDGYEYTWTDDRMWRKSRSLNEGSVCVGTDLNRNFDQMWGNAGTSTSPCSETYGGSGPASELEVQAEQATFNSLAAELLTTIHLHTYSQYWLFPWGSVDDVGSCNIAIDHDEMMVVANAAADATQNTFGTVWARGNWCVVMYPASGNAQDYSKAAGVKYTFTAELRGNSFIVGADQIQPSFEEVWNGVAAAIATIDP